MKKEKEKKEKIQQKCNVHLIVSPKVDGSITENIHNGHNPTVHCFQLRSQSTCKSLPSPGNR